MRSARRSTGASTIMPSNWKTPRSRWPPSSTRRAHSTWSVGRRVGGADDRHLRRVDGDRRVEPAGDRVVGLGAQPVEVVDVEVHRVERHSPVRPGGQQHGATARARRRRGSSRRRPARRAPSDGDQVLGAPHERDALRLAAISATSSTPERRLDERDDVVAARASADLLGGLGLGEHHRAVRRCGASACRSGARSAVPRGLTRTIVRSGSSGGVDQRARAPPPWSFGARRRPRGRGSPRRPRAAAFS